MAEPFFGSGPQLWPAPPVPVPGVGYFQSIPVNRMLGGSPPIPANHAADLGSSLSTGWPAISSPVLPPIDFGAGVSPHALLGAVAMRRGQPMGPTNDHEIEDFISDVLDLLPGATDVEVRCENGRATLTGSVAYKRLKRDVGEIAWAIPNVNDVQNNVTIATRRRSRSGRDGDVQAAAGSGRKQT